MTIHAKANGNDIAHKLDEAKKAFAEAAHLAKDTAGSMSEKAIHNAKEQGKEFQNRLSDYVKKKPMTALGGAVVAGFVLSWLLRK